MFKAEINTTKHRPDELPFLIRDLNSGLIIRYCPDRALADSEEARLNGTGAPKVSMPQPHTVPETLSLF